MEKPALLLQNALLSTTSRFTGIPIKSYWKEFLFHPETKPPLIVQSGKWSAYAHISLGSSLYNFLTKRSITHLECSITLHQDVIQFLYSKNKDITISFAAINQETLQHTYTSTSGARLLEITTGDSQEIQRQIQDAQHLAIPLIIVVYGSSLTLQITQAFYSLTNGCVILVDHNNPFTTYLQTYANQNLPSRDLVLSYSTDTTLLSSLEYHLKDSDIHTIPVLQSLYYKENKSDYKGFFNQISNSVSTKYTGILRQFDPKSIEDILIEYWKSANSALPDVLFQLVFDNYVKISRIPEDYLRTTFTKLYRFLRQQVIKVPQGTLMIPAYNTAEAYYGLVFFTTEKSQWISKLKTSGYQVYEISSFSSSTQSNFFNHYALWVQW